ncbi:TlpA family protein disulfide reductase [Sinomicrobium pectinilyticum]|uniref:TlpA family protein disulfide reductase n=1 Tax=Sinomicrobium pectinilyticum TaxID=1084421 RepID=A0A3N0EIT5_SINP1|nr:TlpA disulfide reductase family protein [Sinomicrobium pectinilyticum]RNL87741.1 TlpA family protein disulfide reductase [Sinomicrobium pectinilyticum]
MKKQLSLKIIFIMCMVNFSFAQLVDNGYEPLKVGDTVPDITLTNLIHYPKKNVKLSDFKGKPVILDFWTSGCASCIESWPKMVSLQEKFKEKAQIILINNYWDKSKVKPFIEKRMKLLELNMSILPVVCGDTILKKIFPHQTVPHIIWISSEGVVRAVTTSIDEENLKALVNGRNITIPQKKDSAKIRDFNRFNEQKPLFIQGNGEEQLADRLIAQSVLTKAVPGTIDGYSVYPFRARRLKKGEIITVINAPLEGLYLFANKNNASTYCINRTLIRPGRVVLEINDSIKPEPGYNYQLTVDKLTPIKELQEKMRLDLKKYFGFQAQWQKRYKKCLVFSIADTLRISYNGSKKAMFIMDDVNFKVSGTQSLFPGHTFTMPDIIDWMETMIPYYADLGYPILDETGLKGPVSLEVETNVSNYKALDKALKKKYGMRLTLEEREVEVLVIGD